MIVPLLLAVLLLAANGFFVAVEFSLIASRRTRLEALADEGNVSARIGLGAIRELSLQLAGAQLGITMASLGLGAVAEPALSHLFESGFDVVGGVPEGLTRAVSFVVALTVVVFLHMVVGEMVPKNIAIAGPERTLLALARANRAYVALFRPAIRLLNALANAGVRLLRVEPRDELEAAATAEEIAMMLGASREVGLIEEVAHDLLTGALDFGDRPVSSVMVRRADVVAVSRESTVEEAERVILATGHSRLPVTRRDLDDIIGFVHAKDLLTLTPGAQGRPLPLSRIRRMLVLPASRTIQDALLAMRRARVHFAMVTDDDDRTAGIVTLEDIIEDLVGDITDESDVVPARRRGVIRRRR